MGPVLLFMLSGTLAVLGEYELTMANICEFCGKGGQSGQNIRHIHSGAWARRAPRTKRRFLPNLQTVTVHKGGRNRRMRVCVKCMKSERFIKATTA